MRAPNTPPSLKWLINRRARLDGELHKIQLVESSRAEAAERQLVDLRTSLKVEEENEAARLRVFERTYKALQRDLAATDLLLRQHEISIDPTIISKVRSQDNLALTDYGLVSRLIYRYLRGAQGRPCNATQVAAFIADYLNLDCDESIFSDFRYRVRKRMQHLAWEGKLLRVENQRGSIEGRWVLPSGAMSELDIHPGDELLANILATTETFQP